MEGREAVLAGTVTGVSGRLIYLENCRLLPETTALPPLAALPEAGGLEPRPLTAAEANAGPGRGIAAADIDRVLYTSSFQTMLDGLGNMYQDRDERVYVLLRDGSVYRHTWSFPFSDLDLALSRRREPGRWLRWRQDGEAVLLQGAEGRPVALRQARRLLPLRPGTRFDHHYYLLHVGMGGLRRDRARYAFDSFVLILTDAEGRTERRFVAQFEAPENGAAPNELVLGGEVYWAREADRRSK